MINSASFSVPIQFHRLDGNELLLFYIHSAIILADLYFLLLLYYLLHSTTTIFFFLVYLLKHTISLFQCILFNWTAYARMEYSNAIRKAAASGVERHGAQLHAAEFLTMHTKAQNANKKKKKRIRLEFLFKNLRIIIIGVCYTRRID